MSRGFHFEIVTPVKRVHIAIDATSIIIPAYEGFLGVLYNHAPLVALLQPGPILMRKDDVRQVFACSGGVFVVNQNKAIVLADSAERAEDINLERAEKALERAKGRVAAAAHDKALDRDRAERALKRAQVRVDVARGHAFSDS